MKFNLKYKIIKHEAVINRNIFQNIASNMMKLKARYVSLNVKKFSHQIEFYPASSVFDVSLVARNTSLTKKFIIYG